MTSVLRKRPNTPSNYFSFLLLFCFLLSVQSQLSAQSSKDVMMLNDKSKEENVKRGNSQTSPGHSQSKMVYAHLFVNGESKVVLDKGNGPAPVLNPRTRKTHKSVIGALNQLSSSENWKILHYYDVTMGNENPAFMLYRLESN